MALDTRGLASGFGQGFGLMDNYYRGQKQDDRAERGLQMREESFGMQKEQYQQSQKEKQATMVYGKMMQQVPLGDEDMQFLKDNPNYLQALNPEMDKSIEIAQRVIDPEDELGLNSEEGMYAMNTMFSHRINRGEGGKKRIAGGYPGQREGTLALDLEVEREDGTKYSAPRTRNAGVEGDDEVLQTDIGDVVNQVQGYRAIRNVINQSGSSEYAAKMYSLLTGKERETQETWSEPFEYQGGRYQRSKTTGELREVQSPDDVRKGSGVSAELSPNQQVFAKRLQSEVDHLWRMERQIQTGQSDGMSIFLGGMEETVTPDNKEQLLSDIRDRIRSNERELNKMLGVSAPTPVESSIVERAQQVPESDRGEFLEDLKANPRTPYRVVQQVEKMFGSGQPSPQDAQQSSQSATSRQPPPGLDLPQSQPQPQTAPQPKPGAGQSMGLRGPETETPNQPMAQPRDPNKGVPAMQQKLGPKIEAGFKAAGDWYAGAKAKERTERRMTLLEISDGKKPFSGNRQALLQFLVNARGEMRDLQPAQLKRLKSQLGPELAARFLNAN